MKRFFDSDACNVIREDDADAGQRRWIVQINEAPPLVRWAVLIGECLFDYRSALDHFVYDLAVAYSGSPLDPAVEEASEFPIFVDRAPKEAELRKKIGAIDPKARDLIKDMQPYGRKDRAALKYLYLLHNFDKHRTLHLVRGVSTAVTSRQEIDFARVNFRPFKHGDVLARTPLPAEDDKDYHFSFGIAFDERGPGARAPHVSLTLRWIEEHIQKDVIEPLLPFL